MKKAHERSHYRLSQNTGIPCAMVLTGSCVLAPVRPAFVSPSPAESPPTGLAPATRAPGPHAFAVRICVARHATHPASIAFHPAFVAIAIRPSGGMECAEYGF